MSDDGKTHPAIRGRNNAQARIESDGVSGALAWLRERQKDESKPALDRRYVEAYALTCVKAGA